MCECQCPFAERSLTPCRKTPCSLRLAKEMEKGGGECDNKGSKTWGRDRGAEDEEITKLKKKERCQLPPKGSNVFCLVKLAWQLVPEGGCSIAE